jgi:hypothetical protein
VHASATGQRCQDVALGVHRISNTVAFRHVGAIGENHCLDLGDI